MAFVWHIGGPQQIFGNSLHHGKGIQHDHDASNMAQNKIIRHPCSKGGTITKPIPSPLSNSTQIRPSGKEFTQIIEPW